MIKMKSSGVEWIGDVPEHWGLIRFKDKYRNRKEIVGDRVLDFERLALTLNGVVKRNKEDDKGLQPKDFDNYQIIEKGDFIFKMIDLQNISTSRVGLSPFTGIVSPAYIRFTPKDGKENKFLYYYLMSLYFNCVYNSLGGDGVRSSLSAEDMGNLICPLPDIETQRKICLFLDKKCNNIEHLISLQEEEIKKLKEYKSSLISETVKFGLDKSVTYIDSGVSWIEKIPKHWEVVRHKNIMKKKKDICEKYNNDSVLSLTMNGVIKRDLDNPMGKMPSSFDGYQYINKGNLLLCLFDIDVTPRCVGLIKENGITSPAYSQFELISNDYAPYYDYLLRMIDDNKYFLHLSKNLRSSLTEEDFGAIKTIRPPVKEQVEIANFLDKKCAIIEDLIGKKRDKIKSLQEYKKSLIFEYVTGKKEI